MPYERPWKSFAQQVEILQSRGMVISDKAAAANHLDRIGYYRLSAYWYPFRVFEMVQDEATQKISTVTTDNFVTNTAFTDAVDLYIFDKRLRLLMLDALERIEVAIRVDMAYLLGERDTFAYKNIQNFHNGWAAKQNRKTGKTRHQQWLDKYNQLFARSKEDFVKHYKQNHGADLPIWVAIEIWDFGTMSQLFNMMKAQDQQAIAAKYGVDDFMVFSSWLRSLNYLRNLAAHHSRLWNRNIIDQPKLPDKGEIDWCDVFIGKPDLIARPFLLLAITRHLMQKICPNSQWPQRLKVHLQGFPDVKSNKKVTAQDVGLVADWEDWW